jgi:DHA2 family multidrug resistance protein-like MFS transporter
MDLEVLHLAIPAISEDLHPTSTQLLWIIDIYGFFVAGSLITMGTLGDRIGRRRLLMIGAAAFGVGSVVAALSNSPEMLIVTRALLGIAGATLAPSTLSLIRNMFLDPGQRTRAIGIWITSFSAGAAIGPLLGGVVLRFFSWGAVFLLAVPVMALLLALGPRLLPEYRDPDAGKLDITSAVMSLAAILAVIFGVKQVAQDGLSPLPVISLGVGCAIGILFVRRQRRLTVPFIDLRLFREPGFSSSLATYGSGIFVVFGGFLFIPQFLQLVVGLSPLEAGLWTLPWALAFIVGSNLTPLIVRRVPAAALMTMGLIMATAGFAILSTIDSSSGFWIIALTSVLFSLGTSPLFTLTNDLIIGSAPPERAGAAAGISETAAELGGALGIAIFGSIGLAIYRAGIVATLPPGLPPGAAAAAKDTLGGAVQVGAELPHQLGDPLILAARGAFTDGLHLAAFISALATMGLAVFVWVTLRHVRAPASPEAEAKGDAALTTPVDPACVQPLPELVRLSSRPRSDRSSSATGGYDA